MSNYSDIVTKCVELLNKKHGYVVISILPSKHKNKYPVGYEFTEYANHSLIGYKLRVTHQTRRPAFDAQVKDLFNAKLITGIPTFPDGGCRYFRCDLIPTTTHDIDDDEIPF